MDGELPAEQRVRPLRQEENGKARPDRSGRDHGDDGVEAFPGSP